MPKAKNYCRYCGTSRRTGSVCGTCAEKLKLVRKIQNMVKAEKQREEERAYVRHTSDQNEN